MSQQDDVLYLLKHYLRVIDASKKENATIRLKRAQGLIAKLFEHCASTVYLLRGTSLWEIDIHFKDFGTVFVTARAALESLLAFGYIFYLPEVEEEFEYRHNVWVMSGLLDRQGFYPVENLIEENRQKLISDKIQIEELKLKIKSDERFVNLTEKQKNKVLEGVWRFDSWTEIAVKIGLSEKRIKMIYSYLCGQAHSGGLSGIQYTHAVTQQEQLPPDEFVEPLIALILVYAIDIFCILFPKSKKEHELDQHAINLVKAYIEWGNSQLERYP